MRKGEGKQLSLFIFSYHQWPDKEGETEKVNANKQKKNFTLQIFRNFKNKNEIKI